MERDVKRWLLAMGLACSVMVHAQPSVTEPVDDLVQLVQQKEHAAVAAHVPTASEPLQSTQTDLANTKPVAATATRYVVQLGAFTHQDQALQWQEQLAQQGIKVVLQQDEGEHNVVRVRSLPFETKLQAQDLQLQLKLYGVQQALIMLVNE